MQWIAPSEKDTATDTLEKRLWDAADQFLTHAGKISHQMAGELAEAEYDKFNRHRIQQADAAGGEFEKAIKQLPPPPKPKKKGRKK